MSAETKDKTQPKKGFDGLLAGLDDGSVVAKLDEDLLLLMNDTMEVARSRGTTGKATGKLTINIAFNVDANGEIEIHADHTIKAPKMPRPISRRWLDPKTNEIVAANPKQTSLPLQDVPAPVHSMRSV